MNKSATHHETCWYVPLGDFKKCPRHASALGLCNEHHKHLRTHNALPLPKGASEPTPANGAQTMTTTISYDISDYNARWSGDTL